MRSKFFVGGLGVLLFIVAATSFSQDQGDKNSLRVKWEYNINKDNSVNAANKLGAKGWELVAITRGDDGGRELWIYKRPVH